MGIIGEDIDNIVSRKDYLKNKKKQKYAKFKLVPTLLSVIIILLSVYVYKQLKIYNSVNKIANEVIEENALVTTQKIYYVGTSYTKKQDTTLIRYNVQDKSRDVIKNGYNLKYIQVDREYIYGMLKNELYKIDLITFEKKKVSKNAIEGYLVTDKSIYYYINSNEKTKGLYMIDKETGKETKLNSDTIYKIGADGKNIYLISSATTSKSIVRYDLHGKNKKVLSGKKIVSNMLIGENNIYYSNRSDNSKIYYISKDSGEDKKLTDKKILSYASKEDSYVNNKMIELNNKMFFIDKDTKSIYEINLKTNKEKKIINSQIETIKYYSNKQICYTRKDDIAIYAYEIETGNTEKVTSARMIEYLPIE